MSSEDGIVVPQDPGRRRAVAVLLLVLIGGIGGLLSGAFGVGGGIVMVPLLIVLARLDQRHASATSLVAIVPAAAAGAISYAPLCGRCTKPPPTARSSG